MNNSAVGAFMRMDRAQRYSLRATAYAKQGDTEQALEDYDRAIRTDGELYWIHALRGSALYSGGYEQGALESYNKAIELAPDDALVLNARARLLSTALNEDVHNSAQAIADAQKASELQPGHPSFVAALATVYAESREFEKAVETQQRAIDLLGPDDQGAFDDYRERLAMYEQGMSFERPFIRCSADDDPSNRDADSFGNVLLPYLAFCSDDGSS